jgi:hypothetical protein
VKDDTLILPAVPVRTGDDLIYQAIAVREENVTENAGKKTLADLGLTTMTVVHPGGSTQETFVRVVTLETRDQIIALLKDGGLGG